MKKSWLVRMTTPIICVSILLFLMAVISAWYVRRLNLAFAAIVEEHFTSIRAAEELEIAIREMRSDLQGYLLTGNAELLVEATEQLRIARVWMQEANRLAFTEPEQVLIGRAKNGLDNFIDRYQPPKWQQIIDERSRGKPAVAFEMLTQEVLKPSHDYLDLNENAMERTAEQLATTTHNVILGMLILGTCGAGAGLLTGLVIARNVDQTIVELSVSISDAANRLGEVVGSVTVTPLSGSKVGDYQTSLLSATIQAVVERLQRTQREMLRAEQLAVVGQLAAAFAHEIRNPLMSIKVLVQSAEDFDGDGSLAGRDLAMVADEIDRMETAIQGFLDFARPPSLTRSKVELGELIRQCAEFAAVRANQKSIRLDVVVPDGPCWQVVDPGQIRQLLLNLILNALEATQEGGRVTVTLQLGERNKSLQSDGTPCEFSITVSDTGSGLPADLGDKIFDPFVTTKQNGTGLGLSICKRVAEAHAGKLEATSLRTGGAAFTFTMPISNEECAAPQSAAKTNLVRT